MCASGGGGVGGFVISHSEEGTLVFFFDIPDGFMSPFILAFFCVDKNSQKLVSCCA